MTRGHRRPTSVGTVDNVLVSSRCRDSWCFHQVPSQYIRSIFILGILVYNSANFNSSTWQSYQQGEGGGRYITRRILSLHLDKSNIARVVDRSGYEFTNGSSYHEKISPLRVSYNSVAGADSVIQNDEKNRGQSPSFLLLLLVLPFFYFFYFSSTSYTLQRFMPFKQRFCEKAIKKHVQSESLVRCWDSKDYSGRDDFTELLARRIYFSTIIDSTLPSPPPPPLPIWTLPHWI